MEQTKYEKELFFEKKRRSKFTQENSENWTII